MTDKHYMIKHLLLTLILFSQNSVADNKKIPFENCYNRSFSSQLFKFIAFDKQDPHSAILKMLDPQGPPFDGKVTKCTWTKYDDCSLRVWGDGYNCSQTTCKSVEYNIKKFENIEKKACYTIELLEKVREDIISKPSSTKLVERDLTTPIKIIEGCVEDLGSNKFRITNDEYTPQFEGRDKNGQRIQVKHISDTQTISTVEVSRNHQTCVPLKLVDKGALCESGIDSCAPLLKLGKKAHTLTNEERAKFVSDHKDAVGCFTWKLREMDLHRNGFVGLSAQEVARPIFTSQLKTYNSQLEQCELLYKDFDSQWFTDEYLNAKPVTAPKAKKID